MLQTFTSDGSWTRTNNTSAGGFRHDRVYCIAIGGGGGGASLGGGGGGGAAWGAIKIQQAGGNTLQIRVGSGGGFGSGSSADDGEVSQVRVGSNNNYRVRGEGGKGAARFNSDLGGDNSKGGGRTVSGVSNGGGDNGGDGWIGILGQATGGALNIIETAALRGGAAGGANGGGQGFRVNNEPDIEDTQVTSYAGGGGDGSKIKSSGSGGNGRPIQDNNNGQDASVTIVDPEDPRVNAGDGGNRGGGGGGRDEGGPGSTTGVGRNGICYVTFLQLDNFPTSVLLGQSFTIRKKSYWDGNENVSFTANSVGLQTFTLNDSRGNRSTAFIEVVGEPPVINSFSFSPNIVCPGDNSTLSWDVDYDPTASGTNRVRGPNNVNYAQISSGTSWVSNLSTNISGQWTLTANNSVGTSTSTATLNNYDATDVNFISGNQTIIFPDSTTLIWSSTGQSNSSTINQGIGSVNNSGSITVSPTETTTYTITTLGLCNSDTDSVTITVYYQPEANITVPSNRNYGDNVVVNYSYEYANISAEITAQYVYKDSVITTNTVVLSPTDVYGSSSGSFTDTVPYNDIGPFSIIYTISVVGSGGSTSKQKTVVVNIDQSPDILNIPDTDDKEKDENPVFAPDNIVVSDPFDITDIDIPVEITANRPIKISLDGGITFQNIRETP